MKPKKRRKEQRVKKRITIPWPEFTAEPLSEVPIEISDDGRIITGPNGFRTLQDWAAAGKTGSRLGPAHPEANVLSPAQAATELGCSRSTVDRKIADGTLRAVRLRKGRRKSLYSIPKSEIERIKQEEN
jgi:excisionase family DNA binding protein